MWYPPKTHVKKKTQAKGWWSLRNNTWSCPLLPHDCAYMCALLTHACPFTENINIHMGVHAPAHMCAHTYTQCPLTQCIGYPQLFLILRAHATQKLQSFHSFTSEMHLPILKIAFISFWIYHNHGMYVSPKKWKPMIQLMNGNYFLYFILYD